MSAARIPAKVLKMVAEHPGIGTVEMKRLTPEHSYNALCRVAASLADIGQLQSIVDKTRHGGWRNLYYIPEKREYPTIKCCTKWHYWPHGTKPLDIRPVSE